MITQKPLWFAWRRVPLSTRILTVCAEFPNQKSNGFDKNFTNNHTSFHHIMQLSSPRFLSGLLCISRHRLPWRRFPHPALWAKPTKLNMKNTIVPSTWRIGHHGVVPELIKKGLARPLWIFPASFMTNLDMPNPCFVSKPRTTALQQLFIHIQHTFAGLAAGSVGTNPHA